MNKQKFLECLTKILEKNNVEDSHDIVAEYEEHFERKAADGYAEEEIAKKLGDPADIAAQYDPNPDGGKKKPGKFPLALGLGFADILIGIFFLIAFAWVLILSASAVACMFMGGYLLIKPFFAITMPMIPYMPPVHGMLIGVALIALGVLFFALAVYCFVLVKKLWKAFIRWQRSAILGKRNVPYTVFPLLENKPKYRLRRVVLAALAVFGIFFIIGFILMAFSANSFEFWHVWRWFNYVG